MNCMPGPAVLSPLRERVGEDAAPESPSPALLRAATSPRKRGEVKRGHAMLHAPRGGAMLSMSSLAPGTVPSGS